MSDEKYIKKGDVVYTPKWCAEDMISWFKPFGVCLEPCRGKSVIYDLLPKDSLWCEITDGVDFYKFNKKVDWIVTNPPYSHFSKFIKHGMKLSDNSVWLLPTWKIFCGAGIQMQIRDMAELNI